MEEKALCIVLVPSQSLQYLGFVVDHPENVITHLPELLQSCDLEGLDVLVPIPGVHQQKVIIEDDLVGFAGFVQ